MSWLSIIILTIRSGTNQNDASRYSIVKLTNEQASEQPNTRPNAQANEQATEHIITKLNLYFNYIINNGVENFENVSNKDKKILIAILEKLDLYISNIDILNYFTEEKLLDYQLQYWLIKEIYFSSYKIFLGKITRNQFIFRYLKAMKYIDFKKDLDGFVKYFLRCIQEEMEVQNGINDRKSKITRRKRRDL